MNLRFRLFEIMQLEKTIDKRANIDVSLRTYGGEDFITVPKVDFYLQKNTDQFVIPYELNY